MGKSSKRDLPVDAAPAAEVADESAADITMEVDEPKAKKSKKGKGEDDEGAKEIPKEAISAIAKPLAGKKVAKHVLKLVKKGQSNFFTRPYAAASEREAMQWTVPVHGPGCASWTGRAVPILQDALFSSCAGVTVNLDSESTC